MGVGGQRHASADLPPGKDQVPVIQEAGLVPGPLCTSAENLVHIRINPLAPEFPFKF